MFRGFLNFFCEVRVGRLRHRVGSMSTLKPGSWSYAEEFVPEPELYQLARSRGAQRRSSAAARARMASKTSIAREHSKPARCRSGRVRERCCASWPLLCRPVT